MKLLLNNDINDFFLILAKSAKKYNTRLFLVGGCVRDYLLKIPVKDFDLIVETNAINFVKQLPESFKIKSIHEDFFSVKVLFKNIEFDLVSTRKEEYPVPCCLPKIVKTGVNIETDVLRRDFTINSMYFEIKYIGNQLEYELIDILNGKLDLKNKTLRVLHKKSYIDDPTRILRGVNFKNRFGFDFSEVDKKLIKNCIKSCDFSHLSKDRTEAVLKEIFSNDFAFLNLKEIIKKNYYKIIYTHKLDINFDEIKNIEKKFNLNKEEKANFYCLILKNETTKTCTLNKIRDIYKYFSNYKKYSLAYYFYKTKDEKVNIFLKTYNTKLFITGNDLILLGYKKGKLFKEILDKLFENKALRPDEFQNKNDEINWVKNIYPIS